MSSHHPLSEAVTSISSVFVAATFAENLFRSASCLSSILNGDQKENGLHRMGARIQKQRTEAIWQALLGTASDTSNPLELLQVPEETKKPTEQPAS